MMLRPRGTFRGSFGIIRGRRGKTVGLVKTRRLAALRKQTTFAKATMFRQRAKSALNPPVKPASRSGKVII